MMSNEEAIWGNVIIDDNLLSLFPRQRCSIAVGASNTRRAGVDRGRLKETTN